MLGKWTTEPVNVPTGGLQGLEFVSSGTVSRTFATRGPVKLDGDQGFFGSFVHRTYCTHFGNEPST